MDHTITKEINLDELAAYAEHTLAGYKAPWNFFCTCQNLGNGLEPEYLSCEELVDQMQQQDQHQLLLDRLAAESQRLISL
ncbi:MAG: hypothetical protein HQL58_02315 [Magnetococcales bacterium]|nr:hypothetical protein [Magnetococcales bacterium]